MHRVANRYTHTQTHSHTPTPHTHMYLILSLVLPSSTPARSCGGGDPLLPSLDGFSHRHRESERLLLCVLNNTSMFLEHPALISMSLLLTGMKQTL